MANLLMYMQNGRVITASNPRDAQERAVPQREPQSEYSPRYSSANLLFHERLDGSFITGINPEDVRRRVLIN